MPCYIKHTNLGDFVCMRFLHGSPHYHNGVVDNGQVLHNFPVFRETFPPDPKDASGPKTDTDDGGVGA